MRGKVGVCPICGGRICQPGDAVVPHCGYEVVWVDADGEWAIRSDDYTSVPVVPDGESPSVFVVVGRNGREYEYEGDRPDVGDRVRIVRPGRDVYVTVSEVL